jgi:hypothetical protein
MQSQQSKYNFQFVYNVDATTEDVFQRSFVNMVEPFVNGVNCGIILFGETKSGKTKSFDDIVILSFQNILSTLNSKATKVKNLYWESRVEYDCDSVVRL